MPIVETKVNIRPNTSIPFFAMPDEEGRPKLVNNITFSGQVFIQSLRAGGGITSTITLSEDQLTQTIATTIPDLTTWSTYDTALGIDLDAQYSDYIMENNFTLLNQTTTPKAYVNEGIDSAFSQTTTYTFTPGDPVMTIFASAIALDTSINVTVGSRTVTVVKNYANSEDFTTNSYFDYRYVTQLQKQGVTRTIQYSYL